MIALRLVYICSLTVGAMLHAQDLGPPPPATTDPITIIGITQVTSSPYASESDPTRFLNASSLYQVENNDWGVFNWGTNPWSYFITPIAPQPTGWRTSTPGQETKYWQTVGMSDIRPDGSISALMRWDYPNPAPAGPGEVKGYPEIIYGQKPGRQATPDSQLPTAVSGILSSTTSVTSAWAQETTAATYTDCKGHLSYDIWLTSTAAASTSFDGGDKTHEIMITLEPYLEYGMHRWDGFVAPLGTFTISGADYRLYHARKPFGSADPWEFIIFQSVETKRPTGVIDMKEFLQVFKNQNIISGTEFLASIELGVEQEFGAGEVFLKYFKTEVTSAASGQTNQPPTVSLTAPKNDVTFTAPAKISLSALASDADGLIARVDFYQGTTLISSDATAPYAATWSGVAAGSYALSVRAIDHAGATTTSAVVAITVKKAP